MSLADEIVDTAASDFGGGGGPSTMPSETLSYYAVAATVGRLTSGTPRFVVDGKSPRATAVIVITTM